RPIGDPLPYSSSTLHRLRTWNFRTQVHSSTAAKLDLLWLSKEMTTLSPLWLCFESTKSKEMTMGNDKDSVCVCGHKQSQHWRSSALYGRSAVKCNCLCFTIIIS